MDPIPEPRSFSFQITFDLLFEGVSKDSILSIYILIMFIVIIIIMASIIIIVIDLVVIICFTDSYNHF